MDLVTIALYVFGYYSGAVLFALTLKFLWGIKYIDTYYGPSPIIMLVALWPIAFPFVLLAGGLQVIDRCVPSLSSVLEDRQRRRESKERELRIAEKEIDSLTKRFEKMETELRQVRGA